MLVAEKTQLQSTHLKNRTKLGQDVPVVWREIPLLLTTFSCGLLLTGKALIERINPLIDGL
jgi:hypothetical protein